MTRRALMLCGGWDGHQPLASAHLARGLLEPAGFSVTISERLAVLEDTSSLSDVDLIVPVWTMGTITEAQGNALLNAVANGAGLAGWHGGMGDAFRDNLNFKFAVGGQFIAHPGDIIDYQVNIANAHHPIVDGLEDFAYRSEQYFMHTDPANDVLATTTFSGEHLPWLEGTVMPVAWTKRWGAGRVFYCALGHDPEEYRRTPPALEMLRRGLIWAARDAAS
jgi:uncharacterized protein